MKLNRRHFLAGAGSAALTACANTPRTAAASAEIDATALAQAIRSGETSAAAAVEAAIGRAKRAQPLLNFMVVDMYAAAEARAATPLGGGLAGVPFLIKDLNDVNGFQTRSGSHGTRGAPPASAQDRYVSTFFSEGLVPIGKSTTPEFGYLPTTEPLAFAPTRNPWNTERSSGGSSGGSAAAVAAGVVPIAHANDGGGSIRIPASNCGLFGLKPSRGRMISDQPGARPLDIAVQGHVSRTVRDSALLFHLTEETGPNAPLTAVGLVQGPSSRRLKVGVLTRTFEGVDPQPDVARAVDDAARLMQSLGHTITRTAWPTPKGFADDFLAFWSLGALQDKAAIAKAIGREPDETVLEPFSLTMAANATKLSGGDIEGVQGRLIAAAAAYDAWIKDFDVVISPVLGAPARPLGYFRGDVAFDELRERLIVDIGYTLIHNVAGAPAMSVPLAMSSDGLPVGIQVSAAWGAERTLLQLAFELEQAQPWISRRPAVWVG
ncbi:amidase [bacterium]|nr:amidase [bacterium]